jgi:hypothetical protein
VPSESAGTPPLASFVSQLGPPFCGRVQSLCDGLGAETLQISAPSISAPSIKDDAVPTVEESGCEGKCEGGWLVRNKMPMTENIPVYTAVWIGGLLIAAALLAASIAAYFYSHTAK